MEELGRRIVAGRFPPGSVLPTEGDYSLQLAVSRTSFREAIKMLAGKGLVESRPKTGTRVRPRADWNMLDADVATWVFETGPSASVGRALFEFRQVIEPAATALAAARRTGADIERMRVALEQMAVATGREDWVAADLGFHQAILTTTGNEFLISIGHLLAPGLLMSFNLTNLDPRNRHGALPQHEAVFEAIVAADAEAARAAMAGLLTSALADLEQALDGLPPAAREG